jgi:hypothetical protein
MRERDLHKHIAELLYEHDCVIVPGFGGFIANYKAAFIHPRLQLVSPPSKQLTFNRSLRRNDGLLANYIAEKNAISYDTALSFIDDVVKRFEHELRSGKRLELDKIGILYFDAEMKLRFIPGEETNFLKASFGLSSLRLEPLETTEIPVIPIASAQKSRFKPWVAAAIILPTALFAGLAYLSVSKSEHNHLAALNPFRFKNTVATYAPGPEKNAPAIVQDFVADYSSFSGNSETINIDLLPDESSNPEIVVRLHSAEIPASSELTAPTIENSGNPGLYFLIAGAFEMEDNAHNLVRTLKAEGFDASIIGKKGRLHLVTYGAYTSSDSAKSAMADIKQKSRSAWVYRK